MRDYLILTDSCCDLPADFAEEIGVPAVPLSANLEGRNYYNWLDGHEITAKAFLDAMREGKATSSAGCSVGQFEEVMEPAIQAGKDILYIGFASVLSATYNSARIAAENLREKYPEAKIEAIDSKCATMGQGLLVFLAAQEKKKGKTLEEVRDFVNETQKRLHHRILIGSLDHLKKGGRLSSSATTTDDSKLSVRLIICISSEGKAEGVQTVRGRKAGIAALADYAAENMTDDPEQYVFITHGDCEDEARKLAAMLQEKTGVKNFVFNMVGPVIANHTGPGMIGVFFVGKTDRQ